MDSDVLECYISQAIKYIRKQNRRPDINAIFKNITRVNATNMTVKDVKQQVGLLIASAKLKGMPTSQGLDSFYIIGTSTTLQADLTLECQQEESTDNIILRLQNRYKVKFHHHTKLIETNKSKTGLVTLTRK